MQEWNKYLNTPNLPIHLSISSENQALKNMETNMEDNNSSGQGKLGYKHQMVQTGLSDTSNLVKNP